MTDMQAALVEKQSQIVQKQTELSAALAEAEANGTLPANADELYAAYNDAAQKALDAVEDFLRKLG